MNARLHLAALALCLGPASALGAPATRVFVGDPRLGTVAATSWKSLRDRGIVKQDLDYSCGAASVATILASFYGRPTTEAEVLRAMGTEDGLRASFADLQRGVQKLGFRAVGLTMPYKNLAQLRLPAIVYVKFRGEDHFSVIRGIDEHSVWLADPSVGNRTFGRKQFAALWEEATARGDSAAMRGKVLVILSDGEQATRPDFFTRQPRRQSRAAVAQLALRAPVSPP